MANPQELLARRVQDGLAAAFGEAFAPDDPVIRPSQHADFQVSGPPDIVLRRKPWTTSQK